ncbi:MAG TPA: hypothetical protein VL947_04645, partial [Cytophagales bacterium]|nr:hypothetical protein [Cytophagales bacterium]
MLQTFAPTVSYALTSGPSQPEVQSFEPIGTTEMVDLFTGDFTYNIPLIEVPGPNGGYPLNLHYNAGIGTEDEASWVGLGWNLNPGALTRQMRGLPDEFDNAKITKESYIKPNVTCGVNVGASAEIFGGAIDKSPIMDGASLSIGLSLFYNNYKGIGYSISPSLRLNTEANKYGTSFGLGLGLNLSSQEGVGAN